jgi:hypothetical protein
VEVTKSGKDSLAYYNTAKATAIKSFIVRGVNVIKRFFFGSVDQIS